MLDLEAQAIQELTLASQKEQPSVKLILFNATKLFPELIAGFSDSHPDIRFSISNYEKERMKQSYDVVIHASEELAALLPSQLLFQGRMPPWNEHSPSSGKRKRDYSLNAAK